MIYYYLRIGTAAAKRINRIFYKMAIDKNSDNKYNLIDFLNVAIAQLDRATAS